MKLYAYNNASESAKALSAALGIKRLKHKGRVVKPGTVLNWGSSSVADRAHWDAIINNPDAVGRAVNKLTAFQHMAKNGVSIPDWGTTNQKLSEMIKQGPVVCRTKLNGHSGEGIVIANTAEELVDAPLYTQYIKKTQEYRCHVMHGEVFFIQRKARKLEVPNEEVNWQVRNLNGGFIYANQNVEIPDVAKEEAVKAIMALGLDFGAVDIIYGVDHKYYVLEVNCAPGLAGTTLDKYKEQFDKYL